MPGVLPTEWTLETPVSVLYGVGPERSAQLERLGLRSLGDLLFLRPRRYEDRRHLRTIREVTETGPATLCGRVVAMGVKFFRQRTRSVFELILDDGTLRLHCRWWNQPFLESHFAVGQQVMVHGRVVDLKPRTMDHPETEILEDGDEVSVHMDRIVPVYPLTEGLPQRWLRSRIAVVVRELAPRLPQLEPDPGAGPPPEGLPSRSEALRAMHAPDSLEAAEAARRRLAWDEFIELQRAILERRRRLLERAPAWVCAGDNRWMRPFLAGLGFTLTEAQTAVLREIRQDLGAGTPMRRLVQGDVGSGKTVVAAAAALMVLESGYDVALMAPTEILARQHGERFATWLGPLGIPVRLRTSSWKWQSDSGTDRGSDEGTKGGEDAAAVEVPQTMAGPTLTVGTHALLELEFAPDRLGLVIIDEQHKFGVVQRESLVRKGRYPHLLVLTATPIPRTLALTLYGDLDVSTIRHLPPGRGRVRTFVRGPDRLPKVWDFVRDQLAQGRQAYVVYPRVDDDGAGEVKAVKKEFEQISKALAPHPVGLLHGRLAAEAKDETMRAFREGRLAVLLATLVVEVGVDVANATVMVIENAERFGLAQLHQLRGRIGRGAHESYCVLVCAKETPETRERLKVLEDSSDGFAIAEADLRLRGPGELLGQAQSGLPSLKFGDLTGDRALLESARRAAAQRLDAERRRPSRMEGPNPRITNHGGSEDTED